MTTVRLFGFALILAVLVAAGGCSIGSRGNDSSTSKASDSSTAKSADAGKKTDDKSVTVSAGGAEIAVKSSDGSKVSIGAGGVEVENVSAGDKAVKIGGVNVTRSYDCEGRSFEIEGTTNHFTLRGECDRVTVQGTSNDVDIEAVAFLKVQGVGNVVTYERGRGGKEPKIQKAGLNNTVNKKE